MSDTKTTTTGHSAHASLPILTEDNFSDWDMQIMAYLTSTQDHAHIITPTLPTSTTVYQDPALPTAVPATATANEAKAAAVDITLWQKSERVVLGCLMATAGKLHHEAILKHHQDGSPVYKLYSAICAYHQQRDASHCHKAWMQFLALRKSPSKSYTSLCCRVKASYFKINCITPAGQSTEERRKELILFTLLSALPLALP